MATRNVCLMFLTVCFPCSQRHKDVWRILMSYMILLLLSLRVLANFLPMEYCTGSDHTPKETDLPVKPRITQCVVHNWMSMTCYWEPDMQDTGIETKQELFYTLLIHDDRPIWDGCPVDDNAGICQWPVGTFHKDLTYALIVKASNILSIVFSKADFCHTKSKVKPDPVKSLQVEWLGNTSMEVTWKCPSVNKYLRYNLTYYSAYTQPSTILLNVFTNKSLDNATLKDLKPFSTYTIELSSIPLIDDAPQGYYSEVVSIEQRTLSGVPSKNPDVGPGSFYINQGSHDRNVTLYWQPLSECERHTDIGNLCYVVQCGASEHTVCGDVFSTSFNLSKDEAYDCHIGAQSEVDSVTSQPPTSIHVPSTSQMLPSVGDLIPIHWNASHYKVTWIPVQNATSYTLYYCKKTAGMLCKTAPQWLVFDENVTSTEIMESGDLSFAMSVQYLSENDDTKRSRRSLPLTSSGLYWSKCVYHNVQKLQTPKKFKASKLLGGGSLSVDWSNPGCVDGYIHSYLIHYCLKENCQATQKNVSASYRDYTVTWREGLVEEKEYKVWMVATSPYSNSSDPTAAIFMTVPRNGLTKGAIAGITILCIILVVLTVCGICFLVRSAKKKWKRFNNLAITVPTIVGVGEADIDGERNIYRQTTLGSAAQQADHSGMHRIAENESNAQLENNFNNHRPLYPGRSTDHERAVLLNGDAVLYKDTIATESWDSLAMEDAAVSDAEAGDISHAYYNQDEEDAVYDRPNSQPTAAADTAPSWSPALLHSSHQSDLNIADTTGQEENNHLIENSGNCSIASYSLVDQCVTPKTPPALPTVDENAGFMLPLSSLPISDDYVRDITAIPSLNTNRNNGNNNSPGNKGAAREPEPVEEAKDTQFCTDTDSGANKREAINSGYVLAPPETDHCLTQQALLSTPVDSDEDTDDTVSSSLLPESGYVLSPPTNVSQTDKSISDVSSSQSGILPQHTDYVQLPSKQAKSDNTVFLLPMHNGQNHDLLSDDDDEQVPPGVIGTYGGTGTNGTQHGVRFNNNEIKEAYEQSPVAQEPKGRHNFTSVNTKDTTAKKVGPDNEYCSNYVSAPPTVLWHNGHDTYESQVLLGNNENTDDTESGVCLHNRPASINMTVPSNDTSKVPLLADHYDCSSESHTPIHSKNDFLPIST